MNNSNFPQLECNHDTEHRVCIECGIKLGGEVKFITHINEGLKECYGDYCWEHKPF